MKQRRFGPLDVACPVVGLGTWQMEGDDRPRAIQSIRRAIDLGMTHIDTAELYGDGEVESLVGEAISGYRGEVFLTSKVHPDHATYTGTLLACEKSLRRLRTDRLDLYLLHWRGTLPLAETLRAFEALEQEGKIRAFGVSNFDVPDLDAAIEIVGEGRIACNQVLYHLAERDAEHVLRRICARHEIALVAYSPLGSGRFPRSGSFKGDVLAAIAEAHGVTAHAVALSFLLREAGTFVIPKAARPEHVDALATAGTLELTAEDIAAVDAAFPLGPPRSKLPYL